jgi:hypothetical protein
MTSETRRISENRTDDVREFAMRARQREALGVVA